MSNLFAPMTYPPADRGKLVVWGYLGSYPFGGMTWQVLQYVVGLRTLGFDVWYVEDTDAEVRDPETLWSTDEYGPNVAYLKARMDSVGLGDRWVFRPPGQQEICLGALDRAGLAALYRDADAVINLCGSHELRADHAAIRCLIYLETDPVPSQVAVALGDPDAIEKLSRYQYLFTYGENIGNVDCRVPVERFEWHKTRPPVILDWWQTGEQPRPDAALTTITSWEQTWNDVTWEGESWKWSKHHEFLKFRDVPQDSALPLELSVVGMDEAEIMRFESLGWRIRSAGSVSEPGHYHDYIQASLGEFTVAKEQYVRPRTGWFSDRSVCYLAAGRPVLTQETGFSRFVPTGEGLFAFETRQDVLRAIDVISGDYARQCSAAQDIAREYFDAASVLKKMASETGLM